MHNVSAISDQEMEVRLRPKLKVNDAEEENKVAGIQTNVKANVTEEENGSKPTARQFLQFQ